MPNVTVSPVNSITVKVNQGNQQVVQGTSQFVGSPIDPSVVTAAYAEANAAYALANSAYNAANAAGSSAFVQYAANTANSALSNSIYLQGALNTSNTNASANLTYLQGVNTSQNTNISIVSVSTAAAFNLSNATAGGLVTANANTVYLSGALTSANANVNILFGIETTQNTNISAVNAYSYSAYAQANTGTLLAQSAFNAANNVFPQIQPAYNTANAAFLQANAANNLAQSAYNAANLAGSSANTLLLQGAMASANANIALLFAIDTAQNTNISSVNTYSYSAYAQANTGTVLAQAAFNAANNVFPQIQPAYNTANAAFLQANTANILAQASFNQANVTAGGLVTANNNIVYLQGALNTANANTVYLSGALTSANASITIIQGVDLTQNASITYLQGALNTANANTVYLQGGLNTSNANTVLLFGYVNTANANISAAFAQANAANNLAQSAYNKANTGGTITGPVTITNTGASALSVSGSVIVAGDLTLTGNLNISGTANTYNSNTLNVSDPMIYLAANNSGNAVDIGFVGHFVGGGHAGDTTHYQHTGFVRDYNDNKWKLFSNVSIEPSTTVTFDANTVYDTIKVGGVEAPTANIGGIDLYSSLGNLTGGLNTANTNIAIIQGVDLTQNNSISASYSQANTANILAQASYNQANVTVGGLVSANANNTLLFSYVNSANANIAGLWVKANNALPNTGSLITTNGNSQVYIANTTPSVNNTTGALVVAGGLGVGGDINASNGTFTTITGQTEVLKGTGQNLITFSQTYQNAGFGSGGITTLDNQIVAPNGTTTGALITITNASNFLGQQINVIAGTQYTFSFYALRGTATDLKYSAYNLSSSADIVSSTSYYSLTNSSTWSRISFTFTTPANCTSIYVYPERDNGVTGTFYLWGAQLEFGSVTNTYIPTTTTAVYGTPNLSLSGVAGLSLASNGSLYVSPAGSSSTNVTSTLAIGSGSANYLQASGAVTGNAVVLSSQGTDANVSILMQPKGTGAFNISAGSSGVNISNGGTVTALTVTNAGNTFYSTQPTLVISAPTTAGGIQAVATPNMYADQGTTVAAGGTGYTVGDTLTLVGGTPTGSAATFSVATVSAGVVLTVNAINYSGYSVLPSNPVSTTGGTGTGCTLTVRWKLTTPTITNAGSGYVEQPTVTFSGGGGSGAAAYASVGTNTVLKSIGPSMQIATSFGTAFQFGSFGSNNTGGTNYFQTYAAGAGNAAAFQAQGVDAAIDAIISSKNTSHVRLFTNTYGLGTGLEQARVSHTASAVNYVQLTGAATGSGGTSGPLISAQGSDTSVNLNYASKQYGIHNFLVNGSRNFSIGYGSGSVSNFGLVYGSSTGNGPVYGVGGTDANIAINLVTTGNAAIQITGNTTGYIPQANSIYVGNRVGYASANNTSVMYQYYNSATQSYDLVFG